MSSVPLSATATGMHWRQRPLSLSLLCEPHQSLETFECGEANRELFQAVCAVATGGVVHNIYIHGPEGEGRSHLLQGACRSYDAAGGKSFYLPLRNLVQSDTAGMLEGLEQAELLCLDDLHAVIGRRSWEEALFHLYNRVTGNGGSLLFSADRAPTALGLNLRDLESRLAASQIHLLHPLPEKYRQGLLCCRARALGLELDSKVLRYILVRAPRHTGALMQILKRLNYASLAARRRLTVPFVRETLQWQ